MPSESRCLYPKRGYRLPVARNTAAAKGFGRARAPKEKQIVPPVDIRKPLKKFLPHLLDAKTAQLREAETVQRIERVFEFILGYDGLTDVSREAQIKGKYCDLAIKIDGSMVLLVEAKACCEPLRDRHVDQAQQYASKAAGRNEITSGSA